MSYGPAAPGKSSSTVAAQSLPVCWQVPATSTGRALLRGWGASRAETAGEAVTNDSGKMYVCITAGTTAASGGPTGTAADITDGTAHWSYVAASGTLFYGGMIVTNQAASDQPVDYSTSAALAPRGAEIGVGHERPIFYQDPTAIFVATETGTARVTVEAYP